ncbi:hypothetical protein Tco_1067996 [Tanacetum coccineum]|uniref:Uncharacterized protein n=1 Tax=Tanacetum coccineum TaxID=301880 RepID=A0ABQ5HFU4_9ASTR
MPFLDLGKPYASLFVSSVLLNKASNKPSLDHSLPKLHGVTEKLDTPIVAANLRITFVFEDWDDFTESPLFRHLHASEDLVEKAS